MMSPTVLPPARGRRGVQGRHVLGGLLAFFGAVFIFNGALVYLAVTTHGGVIANEPYRKGLHYNERIAAGARQAQLGWTDTLEVTREGGVVLVLTNDDGRPVSGLQVETVLGRPATNREDVRVLLREAGPGRYAAQTVPLAPGSWLVAVEARAGSEEPVYRKRMRLWLTP